MYLIIQYPYAKKGEDLSVGPGVRVCTVHAGRRIHRDKRVRVACGVEGGILLVYGDNKFNFISMCSPIATIVVLSKNLHIIMIFTA